MAPLQDWLTQLLQTWIAARDALDPQFGLSAGFGHDAMWGAAKSFVQALGFHATDILRACETGAIRVDLGDDKAWVYPSDDPEVPFHEVVVLRDGELLLGLLANLREQPPRLVRLSP